jgi:hypothetical protein
MKLYITLLILLITGCSLKSPVGKIHQPETVNPTRLTFEEIDINSDGNISEHEFKVKNANVNTSAPWVGIVSIVGCVFILTVGLAMIYRSKQHNL